VIASSKKLKMAKKILRKCKKKRLLSCIALKNMKRYYTALFAPKNVKIIVRFAAQLIKSYSVYVNTNVLKNFMPIEVDMLAKLNPN
jgi:ribosomal protein L31E